MPASTAVNLAVNTSVAGAVSGTATVTTTVEGTQNPTIVKTVTGSVLQYSNPSWTPKTATTTTTATASFGPNTGVQEVAIPLYNLGYTAAMARLDVDGASAISAPFSIIDATESNIGATPTILRFSFDTTGRTPGVYPLGVTISTSDENLPGATTRSLTLNLSITVTGSSNPADLDGDGDVDAGDLATLLGQWGTAGSADLDGDNMVGAADLAILLGAWG